MKIIRKLLWYLGVRRTVTIAADLREWAFEVPKTAILLGSAQRGHMGFFSWDVTFCGKAVVNFVHVGPPQPLSTPEPQPDVEVLFDRTAQS